MSKRVTLLGRSRRNFFTGLAVVLPVIISIAVALWLFNQAVAVSDILLFPFKYIPGLELEHIWKDAVDGQPGKELYWWWKVVAILEAVILTGLVGATVDHVIHAAPVDTAVARHKRPHRNGAEIVRPNARKRAAKAADRRADGIYEDGVVHDALQSKNPLPDFLPTSPRATISRISAGGSKAGLPSSFARYSPMAMRTSRPTRSVRRSGPMGWR